MSPKRKEIPEGQSFPFQNSSAIYIAAKARKVEFVLPSSLSRNPLANPSANLLLTLPLYCHQPVISYSANLTRLLTGLPISILVPLPICSLGDFFSL